jgi:hypothetical protein
MADDLVTCPYNISHTIQRRRFDNHLMKCSRQHPLMNLATCFFNTTHRIKKELMQDHLLICPDKARNDAQAFENRVKETTMTRAVLEDNTGDSEDDEEDWGKSCAVGGGYDPAAHIAKKNVIRNLLNATPSERKVFREEEKKRLDKMRSQDKDQAAPTIPGMTYK